jgi:hypothetical protein
VCGLASRFDGSCRVVVRESPTTETTTHDKYFRELGRPRPILAGTYLDRRRSQTYMTWLRLWTGLIRYQGETEINGVYISARESSFSE